MTPNSRKPGVYSYQHS